jgi:hypothetical protein
VPVRPHEPDKEAPLTLITSYPDLPMEEVYPRTEEPGPGQVFLREAGAGRVAYFPWDIDRTFWEVLAPDHGRLLANAVAWAAAAPPPVTVDGPGLLDVTVWRQENSMTVHLVNLTNPMAMKGPFRELLPVGPLQVSVRIPEGCAPAGVRLLKSEARPDVHRPAVQRGADRLEFTVDRVADHEVAAIDLEPNEEPR